MYTEMLGKANTRKPFGGQCSAPDPAEGAYSAPANPLVGGEGLDVPSPRTPSSLSALRASPLLPHSKISSDAVGSWRLNLRVHPTNIVATEPENATNYLPNVNQNVPLNRN